MTLDELTAGIMPADENARRACRAKWDDVAKPLGSFGALEDMTAQIAAVQGTPDVDISRRRCVVFCADHGVVEEGVTQTGSDVTAICAKAIAEGTSNVNAIAASVGCEVTAVDIGMCSDVCADGLLNRKIAYGTRNFTKHPAMTRDECERALLTGAALAGEFQAQGCSMLLTGEMGIGNTTPTAALAAFFLRQPASQLTGRGAGLSDAGFSRKIEAIQTALSLHHPDPNDPVGILAALGGLEIAGMAGLYLGGAYHRIPVVIDGVISAAAAVAAAKICPCSVQFMLASHASDEPAGEGLLHLLGLRPVIQAGLRLGEGTGGLLLLPLLDAALSLYRRAHRFDSLPFERYTPQC